MSDIQSKSKNTPHHTDSKKTATARPAKLCKCKTTHCDLPYSRFSVKLNDIPCCIKPIPYTTSLPKLC